MNSKKYILDQNTAEKKLRRMAYEILENNIDETHIVLAGIRESGSVIANKVKSILEEISNISIDIITVTLDKKMPGPVEVSRDDNFDDKVILLIDDVTNSGRTLLYALKPFIEYHPKKIQTLVLLERSHKVFPVHPDYVGLSLATTEEEHIYVETSGTDIKGAYIA